MSRRAFSRPPDWWARFVAQRRVRWIGRMLGLLILLALLAEVLASDLPFRAVYGGQTYYPWFQRGEKIAVPQPGGGTLEQVSEKVEWYSLDLESAWWTPIPYGTSARVNDQSLSPIGTQRLRGNKVLSWRMRHWLGTTTAGKDLLAALLHGAKVSLGIGLLAMGLAASLGFLLGGLAGYFGDDRLKVPRFFWWYGPLSAGLAVWFGFSRRGWLFQLAEGGEWWLTFLGGLLWMAGILLICWLPVWLWHRKKPLRLVPFSLDFFLSRFIEVMDSLPQLLLIMTLGLIMSRDIWTFMALVGLTGWSGVARLVRSETQRLRNADYILAARISGLRESRILFRHMWPQVLPALLVPLCFGVGNVIVAESALSFLHIVEASDSWGSLLASNVHVRKFWWQPFFPGLTIFLTVLSVNVLGESLRKALSRS